MDFIMHVTFKQWFVKDNYGIDDFALIRKTPVIGC